MNLRGQTLDAMSDRFNPHPNLTCTLACTSPPLVNLFGHCNRWHTTEIKTLLTVLLHKLAYLILACVLWVRSAQKFTEITEISVYFTTLHKGRKAFKKKITV